MDGDKARTVHECHKDHLEPVRVDIVALDLKMQQIGVILRDELSKCLCSISADDEIIEYKAFTSTLLDDEFLDALSFIESHLKINWNIIAVR